MCSGKLEKNGDEGTSFITYLFSVNNMQHIKLFERFCELYCESFLYHTKKTTRKPKLRYITIKTRQTFIQVIQSILYTVQQFIARILYMQRACILCLLNFFFVCLENVQLEPLMQTTDQSKSTSDNKCCKYYALEFCDRL